MKQWMQKLVDQFGFEWSEHHKENAGEANALSEERATLLYLIDVYNKHLFEIDTKPVRKVREILDEFARELINPDRTNFDKILYKFRQFMSSYRIEEYTYIQKTFDDFRSILWDFVDQISEDLEAEVAEDPQVKNHLEHLKEAVESNSIEDLRSQSRQFIDSYIEHQHRREVNKTKRMKQMRENLTTVKKKLTEANQNMRRDHLTNAYNRKSFDEQLKQQQKLQKAGGGTVTLLSLDIDHFKKFNDTYGHAIGDFVLIELVKLLQEQFSRESDFVARVGGEEFSVILPDYKLEHAEKKAEECLERIRQEVFVHDGHELRFTVSMGIAEWDGQENVDSWMKRADEALYTSKNSGRNKYTIAKPNLNKVA